MAKEEKPLEYQRRIRDTKRIAQRLNLDYLKRPGVVALLRHRLTWLLVAASLAAGIPLVLGIAGGKKALLSGPVSTPHAIFQDRCEVCHTRAFAGVPDTACKACHDGPPHPAKTIDTARSNEAPRCAQCHVEHRGATMLAAVSNGNCTNCHRDLKSNASGVQLASLHITAFRRNRHPEFAAKALPDARPLKLNHAIHMPAQARTIRGMKLPMQCGDCHRTDPNSPAGDLLPVTFEQDCKSCHARELEFDIYEVLGANSMPAPHLKDPKAIHQFLLDTYGAALAANPSLAQRRLGNDLVAPGNRTAWLARVVKDSETFLFQRKCTYCHEYSGVQEGLPVVKHVNAIRGRYVEQKPQGEPWLRRGEFAHRSHRAVQCESCHTAARASSKTADVLIPAMNSCLPCHGESNVGLDRCSECHLYHNRTLEKENRRSIEQVLSGVSR